MLGFPKASVPDPDFLTAKLDAASASRWVLRDWQRGGYWLASADKSPRSTRDTRFFRDDRWIMLFDGDLISHTDIPWPMFREILEGDTLERFSDLEGIWALAAIDAHTRTTYLVSDRLSQYPCFYSVIDGFPGFSTELHTFCRLARRAEFNQAWLHDCLYFQYPIGYKTYLKGVYRLPAASIVKFTQSVSQPSIHSYAADFHTAAHLRTGTGALKHAYQVFADQVPGYVPANTESAIGLTAGFDARTVLAFIVNSKPLAYTYGTANCVDIRIARRAARQLGLQHKAIPFDEDLERTFKNLIMDVVYLSGGLENTSRADVLYSYRQVTENAERFPLITSGIGLDSMFRGHLGPALVSPGLANLFRGNPEPDKHGIADEMVLDKTGYDSHTETTLEYLKARYGPLESGATHLLYFVYEAAPKYFGGEVSIARHYTTLRIPALNQHIIELAFSIDKSALSYSNFLSSHTRDSFPEKELQAYLLRMANGGRMDGLPVYDVPPTVFRFGEPACQLVRKWASIRRIFARTLLGATRTTPLDRTLELYRTAAKSRVQELLYSKDTMISSFIRVPEFELLVSKEHQHLFKVLLSTEIILRLIASRWERFW